MPNPKTPKSNNIHKCDHCDFTTTTKGGLTRHVNTKHPTNDKKSAKAVSKRAGRGAQRSNPVKPKSTSKKKSNKVQPKKKGKRKLNPVKAYDYYFADVTRSYADVAKEFGVAKQTIENIAKVDVEEVDANGKKFKTWKTWAEHRQDLVEEQQKKRDAEYRKSAPIRSEQHLLQYRNLQIAVSQKITVLAKEGRVLVDPTTGEKVKVSEFQARELADVAKALKLAIDGERVIMGLPTSVSTIKPGADDDTGKGWGELLMHAMKAANEQPNT